jgi:uncharacterized membrane protein YfcA
MQDNLVLLLILGLVAGVFAGMFGIGGGVVIVPVLILLLSFSPVQAISTSLAALLLPVGIFAVISYYRARKLSIRASGLVALGLLLTSIIGADIALSLPGDTLKQVYGVFLFYIAWRFAEPRKVWAEYQAGGNKVKVEETAAINTTADNIVAPWYILFALGLVAGICSGMFGIGGGAVIVPILVGFLKFDQKLATGTSLGALLLPVALPGVLRYYQEGVLDVGVAIPIALGLAVGGLFGARLALRMPSQQVRRLYGVFLFFAGTWFILQPIITQAASN